MGSKFFTSDGKDLDSRYLGINDKAKSAANADNANYATSAGSANSATTATTATKLSGGFSALSLGSPINFSSEAGRPYTFPSNGYAWFTYAAGEGVRADITLDGYTISTHYSGNEGKATSYATSIVKKGWTVEGPSGRFYPFA